jgi:Kef-type K+ transport system membrane component KefB
MALGTFLLGVTLSMSPYGHHIAATVEPVKSTLLALFFLSVGLSVDLRIVTLTWAPLLIKCRCDPANETRWSWGWRWS